MDASDPTGDDRHTPSRKPMWPWLVVLAITLMMIYAYDQTLAMIDDLGQTGRDFAQLFRWLVSLVAE